MTLPVRGRSWVIGESSQSGTQLPNIYGALTVVSQHMQTPRQIVVMSAKVDRPFKTTDNFV